MGKRQSDIAGYKVIESDIKKRDFAKLYFLYGDEMYLIDKYLACLVDALIDIEARDFDLTILEAGETTAKQVMVASLSIPLINDRKVVVIKGFDGMTSDEKDILTTFLSEIPSSTVLIIMASKKPDGRSKLAAQLQKEGKVLEFSRPSKRELEMWVSKRFLEYDKHPSAAVISLLVETAGDDMVRLENEVEKFILYMGDDKDRLERKDIRLMTPDTVERTIFQFTDAIGRRDAATALRELDDLLRKGQHYTVVLYMLVRQVRMLLRTRLAIDKGARNSSEVLPILPIKSSYEAQKFFQQAKNFSSDELYGSLKRLRQADVNIKTGKREPKIELEMSIIELCRDKAELPNPYKKNRAGA